MTQNSAEIRLRHLQERLKHIQTRRKEWDLLSITLKTELMELVGHQYGSQARVQILIKHSLKLNEVTALNTNLWVKMLARHKEELNTSLK